MKVDKPWRYSRVTLGRAKKHLAAAFPARDFEFLAGGANLAYAITCWDFVWREVKGDGYHQFTYGKKLAEFVWDRCPEGKIPVLYLTNIEKRPRIVETEELFVAITPFQHYLDTANPDPAVTYFTYALNMPVVSIEDVSPGEVQEGQVGPLIGELWKRAEIRQELLSSVQKLYERDPDAEGAEQPIDVDFDLLVSLLTYVATSESAQERLAKAFSEDVSIPDAESAVDAIRMAGRRKAIAEFEFQLDHATSGAQKWTEPQWEKFFRREPWLLGLNLRECEFLTEIQGQPNLGGKDLAGRGGQRGDSLMATDGEAKFTVLVALKAPEASLVKAESQSDLTKGYRNKAFRPGDEVIGGLAQVQAESYSLDSSPDNINNVMELRYRRGINTVRPYGIVVVGDLRQIKDDMEKLSSFELFRLCLHGVNIVTYDQLLARAKALLSTE